ncbi:alpha/beta fold hydrolase [Actinotalea sp. K2]|uniref:alpha/beta fold hydrolase n=1 Tax=Actinotalea sp. K2 TaxID=2939438 RepID=UPI002017B964|nr:alpha/beta fold hydrolase [Actinotalea sp. K2]MCL3863108.1 alpha/beta fold hydrolase [Actinotalea sp. K2]
METFTRDRMTFDVLDAGPVDGEAVVLLHGFPQDGTAYDRVVPLLADAGLRVLVPDQRGYSPQARPVHRSAYALGELVGDVLALLDAAGVRRAHVVGHDWGGGVAWALAGRHPDRVLSLTALSTPHPAAMRDAMRRSDQARRSSYMVLFQLPWLPEAALTADDGARLRASLRRSGLPAPVVEHYTARMLEPGALRAALSWYRGLPWSAGTRAGRIDVPTVHLYGRRDPFFSLHCATATHEYVRGPFRSVGLDAGHWLPETEPQQVADALLSHLT